jgi:LysR family hydrogen peroxide-inducible transcriptional activator
MSNGNCFRNQAINLCELQEDEDQAGFKYESASIETLVKLVDKEGGITLIPELVSNSLSARKKENVKSFNGIVPMREVSLITSRIFIKKRMREALVEAIQKSLPEAMLQQASGEVVEWA